MRKEDDEGPEEPGCFDMVRLSAGPAAAAAAAAVLAYT